MQLSCTLEAKYHEKGKPCSLRIFLPRRHACQVDVKCVIGEPVEFELPLGREEFEADVPLCFWWYVHRLLKGDDNADSDAVEAPTASHVDFGSETKSTSSKKQQQEQPYTARFGVAHVLLKDLVDKQRQTAVLRDAKAADVATLELAVQHVREAGVEFSSVDDRRHGEACNKWFAAQTDEYAGVLSTVHAGIKSTNVTELGRHEFAAIMQEIGPVPIWAWVYGNTIWEEKRREKVTGEQERLQRLQQMAEALTGRGEGTQRDLEVLNEMVTLQTRATLYVLDTSMGRHRHDNSVDDWTNIRHNPSISEAGADCEDCALELVRESIAIRDGGGRIGSLLVSRFMTCFAIVTLSLGGEGYTYHAICIQVPRDWIAGSSSSSESKDVPVLHEGTSYTTGAWQFETADCTSTQYDVSHIEWPVESICKVPAETVRSNKDSPYGHVVSLYCPELLESKGIAQLELTYKGALGVPVKQFMRRDAGVQFQRVEAPADWKALVRYLMYWMPVPAHYSSDEKGDDPVPPRGLFLNCLFREADFSSAVERRMRERAEGRKVTIRHLVLPGSGSRLVQCTSPA